MQDILSDKVGSKVEMVGGGNGQGLLFWMTGFWVFNLNSTLRPIQVIVPSDLELLTQMA